MASHFLSFSTWSIRKKLLATSIPLMALMLAMTGYATRWVSARYLTMALERTTKVLTMGQADALARLLDEAREDILLLAKSPGAAGAAAQFLREQRALSPGVYREAAYVPVSGDGRILLVDTGREIVSVDAAQAGRVGNSPHMAPSRLSQKNPGYVGLMGVSDAVYPPGLLPGLGTGVTYSLLRLVTPAAGPDGQVAGYWVLGVDARALRDILSLYNSPKSPLAAFPRTSEKRYSFFFDTQGWMLFQSGNVEDKEQLLSIDAARAGISGDHGMPGHPGAFRPATSNEAYWLMVVEIQAGRVGIETVSAELGFSTNSVRGYSLGYAPVFFRSDPDKEPEVVGGVAFMDRSRVLLAADYSFFDVLVVIFIVSVGLTSLAVYLVSRVITRPLQELAEEVRAMPRESELRHLKSPCRDKESSTLKESVNLLVDAVLSQREELRVKDAHLRDHIQRQPLDLGDKLGTGTPEPMEGVIGASPAMRDLKWLIRKAASVDPDVLIVGETGTGKEVTAQAIHRLSRRKDGPFISINCGALDENLLLDALFGHVKGAFSEAKTGRKGAFLAADGGTILLDEIGNASPKVQQALLRALAARSIIPLGSDDELPFDARVIAATNVDLMEGVENGTFREDLYYRLKVLTLHTPPLRERKEDIPLLADAFLKESASVMNKPPATLSRGAWEKIAAHDWPGNVRELKHCIMRAVAMADTSTLYVEDLRFDTQTLPKEPAPAGPPGRGGVAEAGPGQGRQRGQQGPEPHGPGSRGAESTAAGTQPRDEPRAPREAPPSGSWASTAPAGPPHDESRITREPPPSGGWAATDRDPGADAVGRKASGVQPGDHVREQAQTARSSGPPEARGGGQPGIQPGGELSERQRIGLAYLREHGSMTRAQYQAIVGRNVPPRTAQYDLRDLVERGLLRIQGKGPATRYVLSD